MDQFVIRGGTPLRGTIPAVGSKNGTLPLLAATLLTEDACTIQGTPRLTDIDTLLGICKILGSDVRRDEKSGDLRLEVKDESEYRADYDIVRRMRASVTVLGPILAKRKRAVVSLPGGCVIGVRPIDLHLKGLAALGAKIDIKYGYVFAEAKKLRGATIYMGGGLSGPR